MLIARGPYTSRDDSSYEQLQAFIDVVNEKQPHLVIMVWMNSLWSLNSVVLSYQNPIHIHFNLLQVLISHF